MTLSKIESNKKKKLNKTKIQTIVAIIALILIATAVYVLANFNKTQGQAANYVSKTHLNTQRHNKQTKKPSFDMSKVKPVSPATLTHAWIHRKDYRSIGQIAIVRYGIGLNIYRGVGNDELNLGAGTLNSHQEMGKGNYALAAHNMDDGVSYFSPLYTAKVQGNLNEGTPIFITDFKKVYYYKITSSQFIGSYNLKLAWNNKEFKKKPVISLFTCDATGAGRLFIRGRYTGAQSVKTASQYVKNSFNF